MSWRGTDEKFVEKWIQRSRSEEYGEIVAEFKQTCRIKLVQLCLQCQEYSIGRIQCVLFRALLDSPIETLNCSNNGIESIERSDIPKKNLTSLHFNEILSVLICAARGFGEGLY